MKTKITKKNVMFIYILSLILVVIMGIHSVLQGEYKIIPIILFLIIMSFLSVIKMRRRDRIVSK